MAKKYNNNYDEKLKKADGLNMRFRYRCDKSGCPERKGDWTTNDTQAEREADAHNKKYHGHNAVVEEEYSS